MATNEDFFVRFQVFRRFSWWKRFPVKQRHQSAKLRDSGARPRNSPKHSRLDSDDFHKKSLTLGTVFFPTTSCKTVRVEENIRKFLLPTKYSRRTRSLIAWPRLQSRAVSIDFLQKHRFKSAEIATSGTIFSEIDHSKLFRFFYIGLHCIQNTTLASKRM